MRVENSIRNSIIAILGQAFNVLLSFINRTIFIKILGANYLGINGLFSNILSMLSLAELGVGSAIVYHMYKPLANKDEEKLKSLMQLYSKSYRIIGIIIGVAGVILIPFLNDIIKDKPDVPYLKIIYVLFLINSVVSYFFAYKTSIISADQKSYIITLRQQRYLIIQTIIQIIFLVITKQYLIYLCIQIVFTVITNISIARKADRLYPFLKSKKVKPLAVKEKNTIFKHVAAMMSHKVGGVVVNGTDNVLISSFVGVYWVGIYSNYVMVTGMLNRFIEQVFSAITASVGNLNALENKEKSYDIYKKILFANFWIYGFCSVCLLVMFNPFIEFWIGDSYVMDKKIVLLIIINFYMVGMRKTTMTYNTTLGLFWNDRYKPWVEAVINLAASIILLKKFGIAGVLLGTLISTISTSLWVDPYILYKHGFHKKLRRYFFKYLIYTIGTAIACLLTYSLSRIFSENNFMTLLYKGVLCLIIPNLIFIIVFKGSKEFKYFYSLIRRKTKKNNYYDGSKKIS